MFTYIVVIIQKSRNCLSVVKLLHFREGVTIFLNYNDNISKHLTNHIHLPTDYSKHESKEEEERRKKSSLICFKKRKIMAPHTSSNRSRRHLTRYIRRERRQTGYTDR